MTTPLFALLVMQSTVHVTHDPSRIAIDNGKLRLILEKSSGRFEIAHDGQVAVADAHGEARLGAEIFRTSDYARHEAVVQPVSDRFGRGVQVVFRHRSPDKPDLNQTFWVYANRPEALIQIGLSGRDEIASNYLAPIVTDRLVRLPHDGPLQSLFVPYDNDNYFRYSSNGWGEGDGNGDGSHEVGALYDDRSRRGMVIGSIDHQIWKSAVRFFRDGGVRAVAGVANKYTHDKEPHGMVAGREVRSPRFVVGFYPDWRNGLERYGDLNAIVQPPLSWPGEVPFGWNSWSGHKSKVTAKDADAALEFVRDDLPLLRSGGVAYINFDSFWDNLTRDQRIAFAKKCHAAGLKAGIYWTPFVNWGEPDWKTVKGYTFRDLQLKDAKGELLPKLDGGWPLDPTHPGTLARIDETLKDFIDQGFDYIKFDFMTHGTLEGRHYDRSVTTGTAAYRVGMQRVLDGLARRKVGRPVFISLSIAPMFPHGYAHSRRISCDVFSNIGASEYFLNSQNYGWWTARRLYRFNDPDSACVYQALGEPPTTEAEARTRFTASVIGGGMMIEGDNLTDPTARERVKRLFSNADALALAQRTPQFRPMRGDTEAKAGDAFVYVDGKGVAYVAAFNFDKANPKQMTLPLDRLGLAQGTWNLKDLWSGEQRRITGSIDLRLLPTDCALLRLTRAR